MISVLLALLWTLRGIAQSRSQNSRVTGEHAKKGARFWTRNNAGPRVLRQERPKGADPALPNVLNQARHSSLGRAETRELECTRQL